MYINREELKNQIEGIFATLKLDQVARCKEISAKITDGAWDGMTAREIAQELGISSHEVAAWVRDCQVAGVQMKRKGGFRPQYFLRCDESGYIIDSTPIKIQRRVNVYVTKTGAKKR